MMPKSIPQRLEETLKYLTEDDLQKFKASLREFPVKPGYDNIPGGRLQKADAQDLSELLFDFYKGYAVEVTAAVLRRCHCDLQAENLVALSGTERMSAMAKTVRCCLAEALEDLKREELEKFKANLNEFPVKGDFNNIPRGPLQNASAIELSDLLVHYYNEDYAVEVAAQVLWDINCKPQALKLRKDTGKGACSSVQQPVPPLSTPSRQADVQAPEMHFIERHREALIQRIVTVGEILDPLYGVALTDEQYQNIMKEKTSQDQMRKLFSLVPGWGRHCKDLLYKVLREKRMFLIEDLERQ